MSFEVITVPIGSDNYAYIVIDGHNAIIIDAVSSAPLSETVQERKLSLRLILSTHHHGDHTGGNISLKSLTGCTIIGGDQRIPGIDRLVSDNQKVTEGPFSFTCLSVPGHTRGCFSWYFQDNGILFTGDTLFYSGCGRLFEGNARQMYQSFTRLASLPESTVVYCGHEYTLDNLRFALTVDPNNNAIKEKISSVEKKLDNGIPSGPSTIAEELTTNPFFRTARKTIRASVGLPVATGDSVFAALRKRKDSF